MPENKENKPVLTVKDGFLKATTWRNTSEKGDSFYTTTFTRSYKGEDGKYHDTSSFSQQDLLKVEKLASRSYHGIGRLREDAKPQKEPQPQRTTQRPRQPDYDRRR